MRIKDVSAHCDIPCAVYDPGVAQYAALSVVRFLDLIGEMPDNIETKKDLAHLSRLVQQKEDHAIEVKDAVRTIWGDYFKEAQMEKFPEIIEKKRKLFNIYQKAFKTLNGVRIMKEHQKTKSNYWLITLLLNEELIFNRHINKDEILNLAHDCGLLLRPLWKPLNLLKMYKDSPAGVLEKSNLIEKRSFLQNKITNWHKKNKGKFFNKDDYKNFLFEIGYIVKENKNFKINTAGIDPEISSIPGPQLVVPLSNKRYAINAANSRWGSLYDALYGTDIIPYKGKFKIGEYYNESRGKEVIKYAKNHLDMFFPIDNCSYQDVTKIQIINNELISRANSYNHALDECRSKNIEFYKLIQKKYF